MQLEYAYAGEITKADKQADGSLMVYGVATDPSVDLDGQNCDPTWLKAAMPDWFASAGNVREQHGPVAAGVGKELTEGDGGAWMLKAHIVDRNTVAKVEAGVLKGFSIGVRQGKVMRGKSTGAPNGTIVGGKIVEVSLVDRPCNPRATMTICKALGSDSDEMEFVEPLLIDTDPSLLDDDDIHAGAIGDAADVVSDDDVDGEPDGEQDSQAVDGAVDGDDDPDDGLTLFDELDEEPIDVDKAYALALGEHGESIVKGLLESLIHGPKKDGDGDGKVGEGREKKKPSAAGAAAAARKRREAEAERERKHHSAMDAEALQDANHAQRQGRREESDAHRGRLGSYRKALELREYRAGLRLVADVLDDMIVKSMDTRDDGEIIAELAHFAASEADQLAGGGYENPEDVSTLLDVCAAIAKMAGVEPANLQREVLAVDESKASATVDFAEIVKAQVAEQLSEVTKAHEAETANLRAQMAKVLATPVPGGPVINKSVMPSAPAALTTRAAHFAEMSTNPRLAPNIQAAYAAAAVEAAKG